MPSTPPARRSNSIKGNPACEGSGCHRTAIRHFPLPSVNLPDFHAWLCQACRANPHLMLRDPAQQALHEKSRYRGPVKPKRKPNPASAKNGTKGGRPRTVTPAPDALREAARILREYTHHNDGWALGSTLGTYLEPVAAMLDQMAGKPRTEHASMNQ